MFASAGSLVGYAERAARELLATGERVRKRTTNSLHLTARETQIARLAGDGLSNPRSWPITDSHSRTPLGSPGRGAGVAARDPTDANTLVPDRWCWHEQSARIPGPGITRLPAPIARRL